ncbi:flagellin N-terminal helical domain-containing protein [Halobacillus faecis]|uniref:Flagellin n=1 Tax=Halobacillus faecis TaxID=360184 RepID=A0A511WWA1_9BACI|nr:flagellin [Halobacillus faecis]GEN54583.1 hypothetical protein HFA01_28450 [Halobacillus faecis]
MRVAHNIASLNSLNKLNERNKAVDSSMEKLTSGLRINNASDDAAGLGISEKMRAQIRGLEQSQRNIQDGISLLQTAEGALGEIINPNLQRMRELSIQAANDTLTVHDREVIQREMDEVLHSINNIANNTEFNTTKVLRPPLVEKPPTITSGKADIVFIVDVSGSMGTTIDNVRDNIDDFVNKLDDNDLDYNLGLVGYSDVNDGEPLLKWDFTESGSNFKDNLVQLRSDMMGGGDYFESGLEGISDPTKGGLSFPFRDSSSKQFVLVTDAPVHDDADGDGGDGLSSYDIDSVANELFEKDIKLTVVGTTSGEAEDQLRRLSDSTGGSYFNIRGEFSEQLSTYADTVVEDAEVIEEDEVLPIHLQVGANTEDIFTINLFDARTENLGLSDVKVDPFEEAMKALQKVDSALELASGHRSKFGAYQNALEHTGKNVSNALIQLTDAESQIRDANMAKEIMNQLKHSIMSQASQAMLAQANSKPQAVLQLLK